MANNIWDMAWAQILALRYWRALRYWFGLRYSLEILARFEILAWDICLRQVEIFARQVEILAFWDIGNFKASWDISKASWDIGFLRYCKTRGKLRYSLYLKRNEDLIVQFEARDIRQASWDIELWDIGLRYWSVLRYWLEIFTTFEILKLWSEIFKLEILVCFEIWLEKIH